MELLSRLRRAVRKLTFLLNMTTYINQSTWRFAALIGRASAPAARITGRRWRRRRALSFNDRPGLRACTEDDDEEEEEEGGSVGSDGGGAAVLRRTMSSPSPSPQTPPAAAEEGEGDVDVDERAERFIAWFREQLSYERQISLDLRYVNRGYSFQESTTSSSDSNVFSPLISPT